MIKKSIEILRQQRVFVVYGILRFISLLAGFVINVIIINQLSVENYGIFSMIFVFVGLIATFTYTWSGSSILYFSAIDEKKHSNIANTLFIRNTLSVLSIVLLYVTYLLFSKEIIGFIGYNKSISSVFVLVFFMMIEDLVINYLIYRNRRILSTIVTLSNRGILILLLLLFRFELSDILNYYIVSNAINVLFLFNLRREDLKPTKIDRKHARRVLNFSFWQLLGFSGVYLINFGDTAIIKVFLGNNNVAYYNAAYRIFFSIEAFSIIVISFFAANLSKLLAEKSFESVKEFFYRERYYLLVIIFLGHLVLFILSKSIIVLLYGNDYINSIHVFQVLLIASFIRYVSVFYTLYYNISGNYKTLQRINIFRAFINISLDIVLVLIFGLIGPAIATVLALIVSLALSYYICEKRIKNADFSYTVR